MSAIVADHVSRQFPNEPRPAVDDVSFVADEGAFVVFLGPSGCGKTTLLKMINRLYEPTSGRIEVSGQDTAHISTTELRRRIGYVIQQTGLFPHMRIEQNIAIVPELLGWERPRINKRIDELLELIGLPLAYRKRYPRQLSGGEQQRIGLARALAADPSIMLMDEPFGAIDAITRARLQDELLRIQRQVRKTILFVTHDVEEALRLADKIIIMRAGKIVQYDTPLNIITQPHDTFVQQLVGTEDVLRRLSLLSVRSAVEAAPTSGRGATGTSQHVAVELDADLRSALSLLLGSGAPAISVVDNEGNQRGTLDFATISAAIGDPAGKQTVAV